MTRVQAGVSSAGGERAGAELRQEDRVQVTAGRDSRSGSAQGELQDNLGIFFRCLFSISLSLIHSKDSDFKQSTPSFSHIPHKRHRDMSM